MYIIKCYVQINRATIIPLNVELDSTAAVPVMKKKTNIAVVIKLLEALVVEVAQS